MKWGVSPSTPTAPPLELQPPKCKQRNGTMEKLKKLCRRHHVVARTPRSSLSVALTPAARTHRACANRLCVSVPRSNRPAGPGPRKQKRRRMAQGPSPPQVAPVAPWTTEARGKRDRRADSLSLCRCSGLSQEPVSSWGVSQRLRGDSPCFLGVRSVAPPQKQEPWPWWESLPNCPDPWCTTTQEDPLFFLGRGPLRLARQTALWIRTAATTKLLLLLLLLFLLLMLPHDHDQTTNAITSTTTTTTTRTTTTATTTSCRYCRFCRCCRCYWYCC